MEPGWYEYAASNPAYERTPVYVAGTVWNASGTQSRLLVFRVTGHAKPHSERDTLSPGQARYFKKNVTRCAGRPTVNRNGTDCAAAVADAEERARVELAADRDDR